MESDAPFLPESTSDDVYPWSPLFDVSTDTPPRKQDSPVYLDIPQTEKEVIEETLSHLKSTEAALHKYLRTVSTGNTVDYELPLFVYFNHTHPKLPLGKMFALLMHFKLSVDERQSRPSVSIFILADQTREPPEIKTAAARLKWGLSSLNCPYNYRFRSLSFPFTKLCNRDGAPYCLIKRKSYVFVGLKSWKLQSTKAQLRELVDNKIELINNPKYRIDKIFHPKHPIQSSTSAKRKEPCREEKSCK